MKKNRRKYVLAGISLICLITFSVLLLQMYVKPVEDFSMEYNGKSYNVIVEKPEVNKEKYPLVIYHHGEGFETIEPFELREIAKRFAKDGFLVWIPERTPWSPERTLDTLSETEGIGKRIMDMALNDSSVDKRNINLVGFSLGSWAFLKGEGLDEKVRSISLIGFGAPFYDTLLYDKVFSLVNNGSFDNLPGNVLIMVSREDQIVNIAAAETLREKIAQTGKKVDCVVYEEGDHLSMTGNNKYIYDVIRYLQGEKIDTVDHIELNNDIINKWERVWKTGYW
jgi:dienelactone hydrolase